MSPKCELRDGCRKAGLDCVTGVSKCEMADAVTHSEPWQIQHEVSALSDKIVPSGRSRRRLHSRARGGWGDVRAAAIGECGARRELVFMFRGPSIGMCAVEKFCLYGYMYIMTFVYFY